MGVLLGVLRGIFGYAASGAAAVGVGSFIGTLAQRAFSVLGTWGVFAIEVAIIVTTATAIFSFFASIPNMLGGFTGFAALGSMMDVIGLVKPDNFSSCISLIISVKLFKDGLRLYILLWTKFFKAGYGSLSGK